MTRVRVVLLTMLGALLLSGFGGGAPATASAPSAPSAARGSAAVQAASGVLYQNCDYLPWSYAVAPVQAQEDWAIFVDAVDPRGVEVASGSVWKDQGAPSTGTATGDDGLFFCGSEMPGTYTLTAEIHFYSGPYANEVLAPTTFTMRAPRTRTSLSVNDTTPRPGQVSRFKVTSKAEFPNGYFANDYAEVVLQVNRNGQWVRVGRKYTTDEHGVVVIRAIKDGRGRAVLRALTVTGDYEGSESNHVVVR